jgi:hypothetical protein
LAQNRIDNGLRRPAGRSIKSYIPFSPLWCPPISPFFIAASYEITTRVS